MFTPLTSFTQQIAARGRVRLLAGAFAVLTAGALGLAAACPQAAWADVRKADVVMGQTVDARGLAVAQCPSIDAEHAIVVGSDGTVYFERDAQAPAQIASITKVMTALVAMDAVDAGTVALSDPVTVSAAAASVGESTASLQEGDRMTLDDALKALLVPSGNDASVAIAEMVGRQLAGTSDDTAAMAAFVDAMNAKAAALGCADTVYSNPHGLDFDEWAGDLHSTAADQAKVVAAAMDHDEIRAIVAGGSTTIPVIRGGAETTISLQTTDGFLELYDHAIGVKTGFTALAGSSFAGASYDGKRELYAIVLDSSSDQQRFVDAETLCSWVYDHMASVPLATSAETATMDGEQVPVVARVAHSGWVDATVRATLANPQQTVEVFDLNGNVSQSFEFRDVTGSVRAGDKIGTVTYKQRNEVVATADVVAAEDVAGPNVFQSIGTWFDRLVRGITGQPQQADTTVLNTMPLVVDKTAA